MGLVFIAVGEDAPDTEKFIDSCHKRAVLGESAMPGGSDWLHKDLPKEEVEHKELK